MMQWAIGAFKRICRTNIEWALVEVRDRATNEPSRVWSQTSSHLKK